MFGTLCCNNRSMIGGLTLLLAVAVGCGDDEGGPLAPELEATYQTTSHVEYTESCDTDGEPTPVTESTPYFQLVTSEFFGQEYISFNECSAPDECEESGVSIGSSWDLFEKEEGVWTGLTSFASNGSGSLECSMGVNRAQAFDEGATVRLERRSFRGSTIVASEEDCTADLAKQSLSELECESLEIIFGTAE